MHIVEHIFDQPSPPLKQWVCFRGKEGEKRENCGAQEIWRAIKIWVVEEKRPFKYHWRLY